MNFRDHTETNGANWFAQTLAVSSKCIKEAVRRTVVAFGCSSNTSGNRGGHDEEVDLAIFAFQRLVYVPSPTPPWLDTGMPRFVGHGREQGFVETQGT